MKNKTNSMKFRILSLAALIFFGSFSAVSALRIQSQAISPLKISQFSYSEDTPFEVYGKAWGTAPAGEVTQISYWIEDASKTKMWEFSEPFVKTYRGNESLSLDFKFDFSDILVDENCTLFVTLQKATMNGAFAQTLAQGSMSLKFPPKAVEKKAISQIESFVAKLDDKSVLTKIRFKNLQKKGSFQVQAKLFSNTGELLQKKSSVVISVLEGEAKEITVLLEAPEEPGRYTAQVQVFEKGGDMVTGIKTFPLIKKGDFAVISELEVSPNQYFYVDDRATILFSGTNSAWGESLMVELSVENSSGKEVFTQDILVKTDEIGYFSGKAEHTILTETSQLHVFIKLKKGMKEVGVYEFSTRPIKKLHATAGQSKTSFAIEQASQEFEFSSSRVKIGVIVGVLILILLIVGFILLVRHMRHLSLLILLLAFFVTGADAATTSTFPINGFVVNPSATGYFTNFKTLKFMGKVDLTPDAFIVNTNISVDVNFMDSATPPQILKTVTKVFQTPDPDTYAFTIDVPTDLMGGQYPLELIMTGGGVHTPYSPLEIDLGLSITADRTPPVLSFNYMGPNGGLASVDFTNVPVKLKMGCSDVSGCLPGSTDAFEVKGNFCSTGEDFCLGGTGAFVLCDQVGNCTTSTQVELHHYDPVVPELSSFDIKKNGTSATATLKAFESYLFELVGLADPTIDTVTIVDPHACGTGTNDPFFEDGVVCKEKVVSCRTVFPDLRQGTLNQKDGETTCTEGCPPPSTPTPWGTCEEGCSHSTFPFCFELLLNGAECDHGIFPFCFDMIVN